MMTPKVNVTVPPELMLAGAAVAARARSAPKIETVTVPSDEQPPDKTFTLRVAEVPRPAVHVMLGVPLPEVIVPPVSVHE